MAKNKITDLRDHLFEVIELLKDDESGFTVDKAKAVADVAQVIVNTAKIEIDYIRAADEITGVMTPTEFLNPKQIQ